jgi:hypothetical protein
MGPLDCGSGGSPEEPTPTLYRSELVASIPKSSVRSRRFIQLCKGYAGWEHCEFQQFPFEVSRRPALSNR